MCTRTPIKVNRVPVTYFTDNGMAIGKWFAFPPPERDSIPFIRRLSKREKVLWCPYCAEWTVFSKSDEYEICTGVCGWATSNDFYVKTYNNIWK